jgi:uncharacterized membrane protein YhiD involved in acid resistance
MSARLLFTIALQRSCRHKRQAVRLYRALAEREHNAFRRTFYQVRVICREADETHIRTLLLYVINSMALTLHALSSADMDGLPKVEVKAELSLTGRDDRLLEQIVSRLSLEPGVSAVSWEILSSQLLRHLEES